MPALSQVGAGVELGRIPSVGRGPCSSPCPPPPPCGRTHTSASTRSQAVGTPGSFSRQPDPPQTQRRDGALCKPPAAPAFEAADPPRVGKQVGRQLGVSFIRSAGRTLGTSSLSRDALEDACVISARVTGSLCQGECVHHEHSLLDTRGKADGGGRSLRP